MSKKRSLRDFIRNIEEGDILKVVKRTPGCVCKGKKNHRSDCTQKILGKEVFLVGNKPEKVIHIGNEE